MEPGHQFFIVDASILPEVFLKVMEAKRMLETGDVNTVNEATLKVGISRSAFYKYRDMVRPFRDMRNGHIVHFQLLLKNETGVLSALLNDFARCVANILTINQSIPAGECAIVHLGIETSQLAMALDELLLQIQGGCGVIHCEILAG